MQQLVRAALAGFAAALALWVAAPSGRAPCSWAAREAFARFDRRRVARDMADQPWSFCVSAIKCFVYELRQFHGGELGEGARKRGLMRHRCRAVAKPQMACATARVLSQTLDGKLPRVRHAVDGLGHEGAQSDGVAFFGRPPHPATRGGKLRSDRAGPSLQDRASGAWLFCPAGRWLLSNTGKSWLCRVCANCVSCCRRVSFMWAPGLLVCLATTAYPVRTHFPNKIVRICFISAH